MKVMTNDSFVQSIKENGSITNSVSNAFYIQLNGLMCYYYYYIQMDDASTKHENISIADARQL